MYEYRGEVVKVIDGDTVDVMIDLGFEAHLKTRVRLFGLDTPEMHVAEQKARGQKAAEFVKKAIEGKPIRIQMLNKDKYGRYLAKIYYGEKQEEINKQLIERGFAQEYFGGSKTKWETSK